MDVVVERLTGPGAADAPREVVVAAREAARALVSTSDVREVVVVLVSRIGRRLDEPAAVLVRARTSLGDAALGAPATERVGAILGKLPELAREILDGRHPLF